MKYHLHSSPHKSYGRTFRMKNLKLCRAIEALRKWLQYQNEPSPKKNRVMKSRISNNKAKRNSRKRGQRHSLTNSLASVFIHRHLAKNDAQIKAQQLIKWAVIYRNRLTHQLAIKSRKTCDILPKTLTCRKKEGKLKQITKYFRRKTLDINIL